MGGSSYVVRDEVREVRDEVLLSTRRGDQQLLRSCEERVVEQTNQAESNLPRRLGRSVEGAVNEVGLQVGLR